MERVLSHATMEDFIQTAIEEKILRLAYLSIEDLDAGVWSDLNFRLLPAKKTAAAIALIFNLRNLITHNYGIVNRRFLSLHSDQALAEGQLYPFTPELIGDAIKTLNSTSTDIEKRACQKFRISFDVTIESASAPVSPSSPSASGAG